MNYVPTEHIGASCRPQQLVAYVYKRDAFTCDRNIAITSFSFSSNTKRLNKS